APSASPTNFAYRLVLLPPATGYVGARLKGWLTMAARRIGIVGAGPAGLMAAEAAAGQGAEVHVFDAMPSVGRKFLMAGKSGLNLTHAEPHEALRTRYGASIDRLGAALDAFD